MVPGFYLTVLFSTLLFTDVLGQENTNNELIAKKHEDVPEIQMSDTNGDTISVACISTKRGDIQWRSFNPQGHEFVMQYGDDRDEFHMKINTVIKQNGTVSYLTVSKGVSSVRVWTIQCQISGGFPSRTLQVIDDRVKRGTVKKDTPPLRVFSSSGEVLRDYDSIKPGETVSIYITIPSDTSFQSIALYQNDKIIASISVDKEKTVSRIINIKDDHQSWLWIDAFAGPNKDKFLGRVLLELEGPGPFLQEPEDQCGIPINLAKFVCEFHKDIHGEIHWYMETDKTHIWVASDTTNYRDDLVRVDTTSTYKGEISTLFVTNLITPQKMHYFYCAMTGQRSSRKARFYPADLTDSGDTSFIIKRGGREIMNNELITAGDVLNINAATAHGNPTPGLTLLLNDHVVGSSSPSHMCIIDTSLTLITYNYTVEQGLDEVILVGVVDHPLLPKQIKTEYILQIGVGPYVQEPANQCGIPVEDAKFTCCLHPQINAETVWQMYMDGNNITVASDERVYRDDLVKVELKSLWYGKVSTLYIIQPVWANISCGAEGYTPSEQATYIPPVLTRDNPVVNVEHQGDLIDNISLPRLKEGDELLVQVISPAGNPKPGLQLSINGILIGRLSQEPMCGHDTKRSEINYTYVNVADSQQLNISVKVYHPLLSGGVTQYYRHLAHMNQTDRTSISLYGVGVLVIFITGGIVLVITWICIRKRTRDHIKLQKRKHLDSEGGDAMLSPEADESK